MGNSIPLKSDRGPRTLPGPQRRPEPQNPGRPRAPTERAFRGIALCAVGIEKVTAAEAERLGLKVLERLPGRVFFALGENLSTSLAVANIGLRTAERVLLEIGSFAAPTFDDFYAGMRSLPWELCLFKDSRLYIERVRTHNSALASQSSLQAMGQKAGYDRLMSQYGLLRMPESGNVVSVRIYVENDVCSVGVDTSGEALHKRGYRKVSVEAPLKETIAASMLLLSGWNRKYPLLDPFCGSGTIAIEAATFALDFAPGLNRRFSFESMPTAQKKSIDEVRGEFESKIRNDVEFEIRGSDQRAEALQIAARNAEIAGVGEWIRFDVGLAQDSVPFAPRGYILSNPPYGNRIGTKSQAETLYASLSDMRERFDSQGWSMGFMTEIEDFGSYFGSKPGVSKHITNGSEEQWFHWFPSREGR